MQELEDNLKKYLVFDPVTNKITSQRDIDKRVQSGVSRCAVIIYVVFGVVRNGASSVPYFVHGSSSKAQFA